MVERWDTNFRALGLKGLLGKLEEVGYVMTDIGINGKI